MDKKKTQEQVQDIISVLLCKLLVILSEEMLLQKGEISLWFWILTDSFMMVKHLYNLCS